MSGPGRPARYEIRVDGVLDDRWADWFGLQVSSDGTQTVIAGLLPDQAALHGLLARVRDLGLSLISVRQLDAGDAGDQPNYEGDMTAIIEARGLGKQYRSRWALTDCTLSIPAGRVVGLVGPNGAGKTTLLHLVTGLLTPTAGTIGCSAASRGRAAQLARLGSSPRTRPPTRGSRSPITWLGAHLNPSWDSELAADRIDQLGLDPAERRASCRAGSAPSWR